MEDFDGNCALFLIDENLLSHLQRYSVIEKWLIVEHAGDLQTGPLHNFECQSAHGTSGAIRHNRILLVEYRC